MSASKVQIFSPRMVMLLAGIGIFAMMGLLFTTSVENERGVYTTVGNNSFSISVLGHKALVDSMKNMNIPVIVSQYRTHERMNEEGSVLMLLEPQNRPAYQEKLDALLQHHNIIVALPKRRPGARQDFINRWLKSSGILAKSAVQKTAQLIDEDLEIVRPYEISDDDSDEDTPDVNQSLEWTINETGFTPAIEEPQLIKSSEYIEPIIASQEGVLVGFIDYTDGDKTIIISDPDLLSNEGLRKGDNAQIIFYILGNYISDNTTFFIDETTHGFDRNPDFFRAAFEYPFIYFTLLLLIFFTLILWSSVQRFGAAPKSIPEYKTGKIVLIENSLNLLKHGNHKPEILARYVELMQYAMAKKLHAPKNLNDDELVDWLDEYGKKHNVSITFRTIKHRAQMSRTTGKQNFNTYMDNVHEKPLLRISRNLEQWKQEMLNGSGSDKIN